MRQTVFLCLALALLSRPGLAAQQDVVPIVPQGQGGGDASANAGSLSGLTLLKTIPAFAGSRKGFFIQAQCAAGLTVELSDPTGSGTVTLIVLSGGGTDGLQGAAMDAAGTPHNGRIRVYSSNASCQMAARQW